MKEILVIGYGNTFRRDDGAGVVLAQQLVACWQPHTPVRLVTGTQLVPELAIDIAAADVGAVVFVDASMGEVNEQIHVQRVVGDIGLPVLGHQLGPAALLIYASLFNARNLPAWLVTAPGVDFGHGEGLSPAVQQQLSAAPKVANRLLLEIEEHFQCMNLPLLSV